MKSGFCSVGFCEGTRPRSRSGKPVKVCVAFTICDCSCHTKINQMYEMTGAARIELQNPEYVPAPNPDLSFLHDDADAATTAAVGRITAPPREKPSSVAVGLRETARTFTATATGHRQRGQLETEVQLVCNRHMVGEIEGMLTTKAIAFFIDPENPPSQGAIGAVLERWAKMGYATIGSKPLRFTGYTVEGMSKGLEKMRAEQKRRR